MACGEATLWPSAHGGVNTSMVLPFSESRLGVAGGMPGPSTRTGDLNPPPCHATANSNQFSVRFPQANPFVGVPFTNEQLRQPVPPTNAPNCTSCRSEASHPTQQKSQFHTVAEMPLESASNSSASCSPTVPALANNHKPNSMWPRVAPPLNGMTVGPSHDHESFYPYAVNAAGPSFAQSASVMRLDVRDNRMTNRHQRFSAAHPYTIPLPLPNHVDGSATREYADAQNQSLPPIEGPGNLPSTNPNWRLTLGTYEWLFAVMYPKRRPDKKKPTPSGPCRLCDSTCKRAGILQQHLTILHRQRLARKHVAGQPYNLPLALAFVVAQVQCGIVLNAQTNAVHEECRTFLAALKDNPAGLEPLGPQEFPSLRSKLDELSRHQTWVGIQCQNCGMWATRPVALEEHATVCAGIKRSGQQSSLMASSTVGFNEHLKLTASGLAARPVRGDT